MQNYEIICIDDESELLDIYKLELEPLGHQVISFMDALDALDYIKNNHTKIVAILSDYMMPEVNGLQLKKLINDEDIIIPFVMITAFYDKEMAKNGMELKISRFIEKPFDHDQVIDALGEDILKRIGMLEEETEMICSFIEESYPMLDEIEELILVLEEEPGNSNALNTYFRLLHTIKGTASCVGLASLPKFTHKYEDLVSQLKEGKIKVTNRVIDTLLKGLDVLKRMYSEISAGGSPEFDIENDLKIFSTNGDAPKTGDAEKSEKEEAVVETELKVEQEKLSVQVSLLDEFMELSGEITVLRNLILKSVSKIEHRYTGDRDIDVLSEALDEMHKVSSLLQNQISEMRKVTVDSIYRPLKRIVRDASRNLKKKVEISFDGEELRIDTSVGRVLGNALVHLIRNGVDHGVETPEVRLKAGKPEKGSLSVSTKLDGENIVVEIVDDGNGMDPKRLIKKAVENGLYTEQELAAMPDHKIYSLIFESGFSTAAEVTDISGRGVGMDMVRSSVEKVGGRIIIDSKLGRGSKFILIIPIPRSVLIIESLMVGSNNQQFAIPLQDVGEVLNLNETKTRERVLEVNGNYVINIEDKLIPLVDLKEVFHKDSHIELDNKTIVHIKGDGFDYCIIVDRVYDIEEVVCKKMAKQFQGELNPFQGATLIGDGEMALILDLEILAKRKNIQTQDSNFGDSYFLGDTDDKKDIREYLQFELFTEGKYCLDLDHVDRLEEFPVSKITYTGNLPVIRYRDKFMPILDMDFCLGLTDKVNINNRNEDMKILVVDYEGQKIGCLVNEIQDIEESSESIDTVISDREGVFGTIYLKDKIISVLDIEFICKIYKSCYNGLSGQAQEETFLKVV